jgi:protoheme IX farnesyltransferase
MDRFKKKLRAYWSLIKSLQTMLLVLTGWGGYMSAKCPAHSLPTLTGLTGSLFLTISGSTVLNMVYDRDIDSCMKRTASRPLPAGDIGHDEAFTLGLLLSIIGLAWAFALSPLFASIIFAGIFLDVVVYTMWLKRRTPWSILWGGLAGGMPVLAGRALGSESIDWIGVALAFAIVLWIPIHIMTIQMRHQKDYRVAKIPTFPSKYGERATGLAIAFSSVVAAIVSGAAAYGLGMTWGCMRVLLLLSLGMFAFACTSALRPSRRMNFGLFKYASIYMVSAMLLLIVEGL